METQFEKDLHINKSAALRVILETFNVSSFSTELTSAVQTMNTCDINSTRSELSNLIDTYTRQTLSTHELSSPKKIETAVMTIGIVGTEFLACIKEIWGHDTATALWMMQLAYDPEPGLSMREFLDGLGDFVSAAALMFSIVTLNPAAASMLIYFGAVVDLTSLALELDNENITPGQFWAGAAWTSFFAVAGKLDIYVDAKEIALNPFTMALLNGASSQTADTIAGYIAGDAYSSDVENVLPYLRDKMPGSSDAEIRDAIEQWVREMAAHNSIVNQVHIDVPDYADRIVPEDQGDHMDSWGNGSFAAWMDARQQEFADCANQAGQNFYQFLMDSPHPENWDDMIDEAAEDPDSNRWF